MDALFAAADLSGLLANVISLLISFVGVALLFVGYRYLVRALLADDSSSPNFEPMTFLEWRRNERRERAWSKYQDGSEMPGVAEVGFYRLYD